MKGKILKQILSTIVLTVALILTTAGISSAGFQANQNTQYKKYAKPKQWISYIRQMEKAGGAMGLSETLNADLTSSSGSNGIDVHMMKTTEYGAIAILSASGYGNPSNAEAITTTTGNSTGMILNTSNWEWTAGGLSGYIFSGINAIYYDAYGSANTSAKIGDALGTASTTNPGCAKWHSADTSVWVGSQSSPYFGRGNYGIFSFRDYGDDHSFYCRGVAVIGSGF